MDKNCCKYLNKRVCLDAFTEKGLSLKEASTLIVLLEETIDDVVKETIDEVAEQAASSDCSFSDYN